MNTGSASNAIKLIVPRIPRIVKTAAFHSLSLSETSREWDLRTALTIDVLRSFLDTDKPSTLSKGQEGSLHDPGVKGALWVSRVEFPKPEDSNVLDVLDDAFKAAGDGHESYIEPSLQAVEGEWIGYRDGVGPQEPESNATPKEKYDSLLKDSKSDLVVLYMHGGAFV
jgi:hypothetical protein